MKKRLRLWIQQLLSWCQAKRKFLMVIIGSILLAGFIVSLVGGYWLQWDWTGLTAQGNPKGASYQPEKTLWDWMQLLGVLAIPVVVAFGTIWFTAQQEKVSGAENTDNQRERALQDYIDKMSDLLLNKHLHESSKDEKVRQIARIRTLTVLRRLDAERKGNVIQFLQEAHLIEGEKAILDLKGADLGGADLSRANLRDANLSGADLSRANLRDADLGGADLSRANLRDADLSDAFLRDAILIRADLRDANLSKANLRDADLSEADLGGADLGGAGLGRAGLSGAFLKDANLSRASLIRAGLSDANLRDADLSDANLRDADLSDADLSDADLSDADLSGANLQDADLSDADLSDAKIAQEQLQKAKSLQGATTPDGSKHS
jgi:uncharacterized protein YjbI with pentapeptide repeats